MFRRLLVEKDMLEHPRFLHLRSLLPELESKQIVEIDSVEKVFNRYKKPYLSKRDSLDLFIGKKNGTLIKEAPPAYGAAGAPHFYFIHAYNCIYECSYCYLQGYFNSPDIVLFLNHEEIVAAMASKIEEFNLRPIWFHAGEFSDSLALSHLTGELPLYFSLFEKYPSAFLELRTKSANIKELKKLAPLENVVTSFSLSPSATVRAHDTKTAPLKARLKAMADLQESGHPVAIHFDPIIYAPNVLEEYQELVSEMAECLDLSRICYFSLGVVRFPKDIYKEVIRNYPQASFSTQDLSTSENMVRYPKPLRRHLLAEIQNQLLAAGIAPERIYLCME
jgi:spore photoproduct lyase